MRERGPQHRSLDGDQPPAPVVNRVFAGLIAGLALVVIVGAVVAAAVNHA